MPLLSKVKLYKPETIDLALLAESSAHLLGKKPFQWQLDAAATILKGEDVILDVGTGSGKTLCFSLPLLLDDKDISITISPLTALMIDQVSCLVSHQKLWA